VDAVGPRIHVVHAGQVVPRDIRAGEIVILTDGTHARVTSVKYGVRGFSDVGIDWKAISCTASGLALRRHHDVLVRQIGAQSPTAKARRAEDATHLRHEESTDTVLVPSLTT
jgi:hypothetical protein